MNMTIITDLQYNYNIFNFVLEKDYEFMMNLASLLAYCQLLTYQIVTEDILGLHYNHSN
jgi:hypothetical protein